MELAEIQALPTAQQMTLAYLGLAERRKLAPAFALDFRLSRIVGTANEPMLAQIRIAWWRDNIAKPKEERPIGDAVLAGISEEWEEKEGALHDLVNAWEELLLVKQLNKESSKRIAGGRAAFLTEAIKALGGAAKAQHANSFATRWALADMAAHCSKAEERDMLVAIANEIAVEHVSLPRNLRGILVLDALARHALKCGGRPLAEGRKSAFIALRAGLLGR